MLAAVGVKGRFAVDEHGKSEPGTRTADRSRMAPILTDDSLKKGKRRCWRHIEPRPRINVQRGVRAGAAGLLPERGEWGGGGGRQAQGSDRIIRCAPILLDLGEIRCACADPTDQSQCALGQQTHAVGVLLNVV